MFAPILGSALKRSRLIATDFYVPQEPERARGTGIITPRSVSTRSRRRPALSVFGIELPNGSTKETTALAVGSEGDIVAIYGVNTPGDFRFYQRVHVGVGPQDLYTVGFLGPIAN